MADGMAGRLQTISAQAGSAQQLVDSNQRAAGRLLQEISPLTELVRRFAV